MKKRLVFVLLAVLLIAALVVNTAPVKASVDSLTSVYWSCSEASVTGTFSGATTKYVKLFVFVYVEGVGIDPNNPIGEALVGTGTSGNYGGGASFSAVPDGTELYIDISTYNTAGATWLDWDGEQWFSGIVTCNQSPQFRGPSIPPGAEQKRIVCDVAVFDAPGGNPVGSNRLLNGQTWYVLPDIVKAADGSDWQKVYVSGASLVYIPARCVEGYKAGAKVSAPATSSGTSSTVYSVPGFGQIGH